MRMPKWLHGWGRGTVAVRKSLGLATKGILDQGRGGKVQGRVVSFDKMYTIIGTKKTTFKTHRKVQGIKQYSTAVTKQIKGKKIFKFTQKHALHATKQMPFLSHSVINGIKKFRFLKTENLIGSKQYLHSKKLTVTGTRQNKQRVSYNIKGIKQISFAHTKVLKAKRDVRQILLALGIFGGNNG